MPGSGWGSTLTSRSSSRTSAPPPPRSSCRCRGSSRRSTPPRSRNQSPRARARSSEARRRRRSPGVRRRRTAGRGPCSMPDTPCSTGSATGNFPPPLGGRWRNAVSGGAPLGPRLGHFYRGIGLTVLEGYGLTETTAPATLNTPGHMKIGTVGTPLPGVAIQIADDGEILVKGNNVFTAYRNNPTATHKALVDGWFHTGDVGQLDDEGFLKITGRKKELLIPAGGKNVVPAFLEDRLRAHPLVSQCIEVGDQRPFIGALITLDAEMLPSWANNNRLLNLSLDDARTNLVVRTELQRAVDLANKTVRDRKSVV